MSIAEARYVEGKSILHRLNPLSKLLVLLLVSVALFLFEDWRSTAALVALLCIAYFLGRLGAKRFFGVLKTLPVFVAIIVLARMFLVDRALPWGTRALAGALQALRVTGLVIALHLFVSVTDAVAISDSVAAALRPLRRIGARIGELSLTTMIAASFVPFMGSEVQRLRMAQAARCGFPRRGIGAIRATVPLVAPLVVGVLRRTDELELALAARCYHLDLPRRARTGARPRLLDYAVSAAAVVVFLGALWARGLSH
jgi:energy-coupling factor transport system permease protein